MDKIAVTTPGAQLAGFPGPRGAMRVGPGVSVPVFAVPGKQNPTWVRIRPNNEGNPPHLTQLRALLYLIKWKLRACTISTRKCKIFDFLTVPSCCRLFGDLHRVRRCRKSLVHITFVGNDEDGADLWCCERSVR